MDVLRCSEVPPAVWCHHQTLPLVPHCRCKRGHVTFKRSAFLTSLVVFVCKLYANTDPDIGSHPVARIMAHFYLPGEENAGFPAFKCVFWGKSFLF